MEKKELHTSLGKGVFPYQYAFTLLFPIRNIFMSPKQLIYRLEIKETDQVLEVGPGPGYFSIPVAKELTQGQLVLADIQQEMLDYAQKRVNKRKLQNVSYSLCDGNSFPFDDESFDIIFMITVIGEVENKEAYMHAFYRMLKQGGILSFSEQAGDSDKMKSHEIRQLAEQAGFTFYKMYGKEKNYTLNLKK